VKVIVGLGNPGREYARTRHNAGFMAVDTLASRHAAGEVARSRFQGLAVETRLSGGGAEEKVLLLKPMSYMNRSGPSVAEALRFYRLSPEEDLLVLVDEVNLDAGKMKVNPKGSDGGHNGLADVQRCLGTERYARCRVGIGPRGVIPQKDYVLGRFTEAQLEAVGPVIARAADAAEVWALEGIDAAMNRFNERRRREAEPAPGDETRPSTDEPSAREKEGKADGRP
jgi:PTH1 family peptidyl-tRNA hydrolase